MTPFKPGDKVVCIRGQGGTIGLVEGEEYVVRESDMGFEHMVALEGGPNWDVDRFKLVTPALDFDRPMETIWGQVSGDIGSVKLLERTDYPPFPNTCTLTYPDGGTRGILVGDDGAVEGLPQMQVRNKKQSYTQGATWYVLFQCTPLDKVGLVNRDTKESAEDAAQYYVEQGYIVHGVYERPAFVMVY